MEPREGLWAYYRNQFYGIFFTPENRGLDHASWFSQLGLPEFGPEFDQIVRGRLLWDWQVKQHILLWYAYPKLPNRIYLLVQQFFGLENVALLEKPVFCDWM